MKGESDRGEREEGMVWCEAGLSFVEGGMVVHGGCCWLGTVVCGWVVVVCDGGLPFVGGRWSFVVGDGCL